MSASDKKKLRREENRAKAEAKQAASAKEAARLKLYTIIFAVALVLMIAVFVLTTIFSTGILEKTTKAVTVGDHTLSSDMLNYFYVDQVYNWFEQYYYYISMFGLDVTQPLDQQTYMSSDSTWADAFLVQAINTIRTTYALYDDAVANGFTLSSEDETSIKATLSNYALYALQNDISLDDYLVSLYGRGANQESFQEYLEVVQLATSYYTEYYNGLTYDQDDFDAAQAENFDLYSTYDYTYYFVSYLDYREGGTTSESGTTTYSDEEKAAAAARAKEVADSLLPAAKEGPDALKAAALALDINIGKTEDDLSAFAEVSFLQSKLNSSVKEWMTAEGRKAGDVAVLESTSTSTAEDGTETTTVIGYYVVYFEGKETNEFEMVDVRHILVAFETDDDSSDPTEAQREAARLEAADILLEWTAGEKTEDSFAELAEKYSDDSSASNGGLIENIYPGVTAEAFENWCLDDSRQYGDANVIETEYGYHVMFYIGENGTTYRNYMIENELRDADANSWYTALVEATEVELVTDRYVDKDMILYNS